MITHTLNKAVTGNYDYLIKRMDTLDPNTRWQVNIVEYKGKRSVEQNSRLWKLYNDLGQYIGHSPDEVHQLMGYKFLRYQTVVNGETIEAIKSTTKLNTHEMTDYQDAIVRWAADIGFIWNDNE